MTTQTPITNIAPALARAQKQIAVADRSSINSDYQSRFADLSSIILAAREALAENEISILQPLGGSASELLIQTVLMHSTGEIIETEIRIRPEDPNNMDAVTSLVTKWRRYGLQSLLCIATKDDDGVSAKNCPMPAKPQVKIAAPIEKQEVDKPAEPATEPVTTSKQNEDWKEVIVHVGTETSPYKGKILGEIDAAGHQWLHKMVLPTLGKTKKDRALAAAIEESVKGPELPLNAPEAPPEDKNPKEPPQNAKEEPSSEAEEPMEWRSIACHSFKSSPKTTLGELADSAPDKYIKDWDGPKIVRWLKSEGIAKIQSKPQTTKDKILVNAILAANEEMDLRDSLALRFADFGIDFNAHLVKSDIFKDGETLANVSRKMLDYLNANWADVEATFKEAK